MKQLLKELLEHPGLAFWSMGVGVVLTLGLGFGLADWDTQGTIKETITTQAEATGKALVNAGLLITVCVANAEADPEMDAKLKTVVSASSEFSRTSAMVRTGWAAFEGVTLDSEHKRILAEQCMEALLPA